MTALPDVPIGRWTYPTGKHSARARTQLWVIHTVECPMEPGRVQSITSWGAGAPEKVSWHYTAGPDGIATMVPVTRTGWHATRANRVSIGIEQTAYARYTRARWLQPDGLATIANTARAAVESGLTNPTIITDPTVIDRIISGADTTTTGYCSHAIIQPNDRTDPGAGYPWDILLDFTRQLLNPTTTEDPMPGTVTSDYISEQVKALGDQVQKVANTTVDVPYIKAQLKTLGDQIQLVANAQILDRQALIGAVEAAARAQGGTVDPEALARDVADRLDVKVTPKAEEQK